MMHRTISRAWNDGLTSFGVLLCTLALFGCSDDAGGMNPQQQAGTGAPAAGTAAPATAGTSSAGTGTAGATTAPVAGGTATSTAGTRATAGTGAAGAGGATTTAGTSAATAAGTSGGTAGMPAPATGGTGAAGSAAGTGGSSGEPAATGGPMPAACPATSSIKAGESMQTIQIGGMSRNYIMHVPSSYDGKTPMPLVIDWHPLFGSASGERMLSGYAALGDREGFITLFPQGIDNSWNFGPCCTRSREVDDYGFGKAMVERMRTEGCIDTKRVYSVGYSNGGGMSLYLACKFADTFAAIAPAAFDLVQESEAPCMPSRPISVLSSRGTADPIVLYDAHESRPPTPYPLDPIHFLGAEGTFKRFAELNKCTDQPMASGGCQTHKMCAAGVEVTLCTTQGGGHDRGDADKGWAFLKRFSIP